MLEQVEVVRDEEGYWVHPALCGLEADVPFTDGPAVVGMEWRFVRLDRDNDTIAGRYFESNDPDVSDWTPTPPEGEGWMLIAIYDTETVPCAAFARPGQESRGAVIPIDDSYIPPGNWFVTEDGELCKVLSSKPPKPLIFIVSLCAESTQFKQITKEEFKRLRMFK